MSTTQQQLVRDTLADIERMQNGDADAETAWILEMQVDQMLNIWHQANLQAKTNTNTNTATPPATTEISLKSIESAQPTVGAATAGSPVLSQPDTKIATKPETESPYNSTPTLDLTDITDIDIRPHEMLAAQAPTRASVVGSDGKPQNTTPSRVNLSGASAESNGSREGDNSQTNADPELIDVIEAATAGVEGRLPNLSTLQSTEVTSDPSIGELTKAFTAGIEGRKYLPRNTKDVANADKDPDRKLYEEYKSILGNNIVSLENFIEIRYNERSWNEFKAYSSSIEKGELSVFTDFQLYQDTSKEMDDKLLGVVTNNNIKITGKSAHSIARVIGSVEQRRNGVQVSDVLDALTNEESEILLVRTMTNGRSQKFRNKVCEVSVNPDTGNIIQVNPVHSKGR